MADSLILTEIQNDIVVQAMRAVRDYFIVKQQEGAIETVPIIQEAIDGVLEIPDDPLVLAALIELVEQRTLSKSFERCDRQAFEELKTLCGTLRAASGYLSHLHVQP